MPDVPENVVHWLLGLLVLGAWGLFLFLLKRTFNEFEGKLKKLFEQMEVSMLKSQSHETRLALIEQRLDTKKRR